MSTVALEYADGAALDVQLAADLTGDMVIVARTLFALPQPQAPLSAGPEEVQDSPAQEAAPAAVPVAPEAVPVPAAVPVAIPALPEVPALAAPTALPMPSALPVPPLEVPAAMPADPVDDVVAIPASKVAPHSMAMLSEIAFLDD